MTWAGRSICACAHEAQHHAAVVGKGHGKQTDKGPLTSTTAQIVSSGPCLVVGCDCKGWRWSYRRTPQKRPPTAVVHLTDDEIGEGTQVIIRRPAFEVEAVEGVDFRRGHGGAAIYFEDGVSHRWGNAESERTGPHTFSRPPRYWRTHSGVNVPGTVVSVQRLDCGAVFGLAIRREDDGEEFYARRRHPPPPTGRAPDVHIDGLEEPFPRTGWPAFVVRIRSIRTRGGPL